MSERRDYASWAARSWAELVPDLEAEYTDITIRFQRASRQLTELQKRHLKAFAGHGITGIEDFRTMALLRRADQPGLQVSEIADMLRVTRGAVSNRLDRFEAEGYITRVANRRDRRSHFVQLTESGVELAEEMFTSLSAVHQDFFAPLVDDDVHELARILHHLTDPGDRMQPPRVMRPGA